MGSVTQLRHGVRKPLHPDRRGRGGNRGNHRRVAGVRQVGVTVRSSGASPSPPRPYGHAEQYRMNSEVRALSVAPSAKGKVPFGEYRTWYRVTGELHSA